MRERGFFVYCGTLFQLVIYSVIFIFYFQICSKASQMITQKSVHIGLLYCLDDFSLLLQ